MDVVTRCICPPHPDGSARHEQDTFKLRDTLGFRDAVTYKKTVQMHSGQPAEMLAAMTALHLFTGIEAWSLTDAKGYAIPVDRDTIETVLMPELDVAMQIADTADDLYMPVILPLVTRGTVSWRPTPTEPSTSPAPAAGDSLSPIPTDQSKTSKSAKSSTRSKPSSTASTPTDGTVTTSGSPVDVSYSWQS